ncbi:MAG: PspC domain-containing protein [Deltaproteobacteria bacterium]|nr:PspC domain-containing protein [Deltaproteobacteria bacterium]
MSYSRNNVKGPFRSRHGMILGVVAGLSEYFGISRWLLRAIVIAIGIFLAFWPVILVYLISAFIMPLNPYANRF